MMSDSAAKQVELLTETNLLLRLAACERELEERSTELSELKRKRSLNLPVLIPLLVATIGATASIISVAVSQYHSAALAAQSAAAVAALERESQQATLERELLKTAFEADPLRTDSFLRFLAISGMIPTYRSSVLDALDRGFSFSVAHGRGGAGFFPGPQIEYETGQFEQIWGNYSGRSYSAPFQELHSHGLRNAQHYCQERGFEDVSGFDISCTGEDESAYVAYVDGAWSLIESGSSNDYCFPLIEWVQCR